MLFNSFNFALFLPVVFFLYWIVAKSNLKLQNGLLLASSYFFYACWDYRFLYLLVFSTILGYIAGIQIHRAADPAAKKKWFWLSILINLGFLVFFKYCNFFITSFADALMLLGIEASFQTLQVILQNYLKRLKAG